VAEYAGSFIRFNSRISNDLAFSPAAELFFSFTGDVFFGAANLSCPALSFGSLTLSSELEKP
jgi:hypothetical protein